MSGDTPVQTGRALAHGARSLCCLDASRRLAYERWSVFTAALAC